LLFAGIILFMRHRRRSSAKGLASESEETHIPPELDGVARFEAGGNPRSELVASKLYPAHELAERERPNRIGELKGNQMGLDSTTRSENTTVEERRGEQINRVIASSTASNLNAVENSHAAGLDRNALAARELEWLEKEEETIREQKARLLARNQQ
jgi:hypothetical protein